jgi:hypothetical protein
MFELKTRFGSNLVTMKAQVQLKVKAMEVPNDLHSGENSSTFIVQAKGPIPTITNKSSLEPVKPKLELNRELKQELRTRTRTKAKIRTWQIRN